MAAAVVEIEAGGAVTHVWLNRPELRNAFNPAVIDGLREAFAKLAADPSVRAVVIGGRGPVFCAGADLAWMKETAGYGEQENLADAWRLAQMLRELDNCPMPVVARVQRAAYGGALGILACCDCVICSEDAQFAFSEVQLGISPATIAPYVVAKTGIGFAREMMLAGKRFGAARAREAGLVSQVVPEAELDAAVQAELDELLKGGMLAVQATKQLLHRLQAQRGQDMLEETAQLIARLRASTEGQEGLAAFLEKREPRWRS